MLIRQHLIKLRYYFGLRPADLQILIVVHSALAMNSSQTFQLFGLVPK